MNPTRDTAVTSDPRESAGERPAATLPWPNAPAYVLAVIGVIAVLLVPYAIVAGGLSLTEAVEGYYLQSSVLFAVLGALILRRRPGHVIGWLLVGIGLFGTLVHFSDVYVLLGLADLPRLPSLTTLQPVVGWLWVPSAAGIVIALPQVFPDGRLLSPRWRPLAWFGGAAAALLATLFILDPDEASPLFTFAFPLFGLAALASLVPLVVRYRRSRGVERQQLKWVFYGLAVTLPFLFLGTTGVFLGAASAAFAIPVVLVVPAAITVAVLRYRLFDIDVVISRTLLVAGLAVFIAVAYVAIVVGVGSLVGGGDDRNLALSVVATAVVAVAFQPVRRRLQRVANRLVFGRRATPYDVLSGFATRVGAAEPSPDTLVQLAELLAGGTGAKPARVWLRVGSQLRPAATWPPGSDSDDTTAVELESAQVDGAGVDEVDATPALPDADLAVPVRDQGELLGMLTIAKPRGERVTEVDVELLGRLAAASGVVLRNLRLDAELAQRLTDLEASRRRLLSAQNDARQRIEAELAGGTRAQLAALRERLSGLCHEVDADAAPKTAMLLAQLVAATDGAMETLNSLAAGVYPPRLASDGLAAALAEEAGKAALPITVDAAGVGRYPAEVEAAVYFSVLEALQNVAKYADADCARVALAQDDELLRFEVTDDGSGFDQETTTKGSGLQGMSDRLDTVGGTMVVASAPGRGTTVTGFVPALPTDTVPVTTSEHALAGATR